MKIKVKQLVVLPKKHSPRVTVGKYKIFNDSSKGWNAAIDAIGNMEFLVDRKKIMDIFSDNGVDYPVSYEKLTRDIVKALPQILKKGAGDEKS